MNSNLVKPEKFGHLHLVYHFAIPFNKFVARHICTFLWLINVPVLNSHKEEHVDQIAHAFLPNRNKKS